MKLTLSKAFTWIFLSTVLISGSATLVWLYYERVQLWRMNDKAYQIVAIVQTGPEKQALKTAYLAEILNLSLDQPTNLYRFDTKEAEKKLLANPLIKEAIVKKVQPGTIYIDYTIRQPVAFLGDYTNTVLDSEGILFPFNPFFTPKRLPVIYLGEEDSEENFLKWGAAIKGEKKELAFALLEKLNAFPESKRSQILRLDVSKAISDSYGQRQIIVILEDVFEKEQGGHSILCLCPRILRLSTDHYSAQLTNYFFLRQYLLKQEMLQAVDDTQPIVRADPMIIDLRIPQLAFIQEKQIGIKK